MTTAARLSDALWARDSVRAAFRSAKLMVALSELGTALEERADPPEVDWGALLSWASLTVRSPTASHIEGALVAAIAALLHEDPGSDATARQAAAMAVLEEGSNHPTVALALGRYPAISNKEAEETVFEALTRHRRRLVHTIRVPGEDGPRLLPVTSFQAEAFSAIGHAKVVSISAPTSAGKSFVLLHWLTNFLRQNPSGTVAYVVPSRALIRQVANDIKDRMKSESDVEARVMTLPSLVEAANGKATVLVMTQERLDRLHGDQETLRVDVLLIDEAHHLGDGTRGVILRRVRDRILTTNPSCKLIMASPHVSNPEALLPWTQRATETAGQLVVSVESPSVVQNLYWVNQVPRRRRDYGVEVITDKGPESVGIIRFPSPVTGIARIMANVSVGLGRGGSGNVVFANGPGQAESIALQIRDLLQVVGESPQAKGELADLASLARTHIHSKYPLAATLPYGVGIHYGDMPEIARRAQERLFQAGVLKFLVCTPTLLAGVNLPCRNLFLRGPRQGKGNAMEPHAFWNLAGRAGRWGKEFAGNVFAVDVHNEEAWPSGPPLRRTSTPVDTVGSEILENLPDFQSFTAARDIAEQSKKNRLFEHTLGELTAAHLNDPRGLDSVNWLRGAQATQRTAVRAAVEAVAASVTCPPLLIERNSTIHPVLISRLLNHLRRQPAEHAHAYLPMAPHMRTAWNVLSENLRVCDDYLGSQFGSQAQRNLKASIAVDWIRGVPLGRIIDRRVQYVQGRNPKKAAPTIIREVMNLINEEARFKIPKYLGCYTDCVRQWLVECGRNDLLGELEDVQDYLETGTAGKTTLALVGLGLTRTAAVEVEQHIPASDWTTTQVVEWLTDRDLEPYGLSPVILREVAEALENADVSS